MHIHDIQPRLGGFWSSIWACQTDADPYSIALITYPLAVFNLSPNKEGFSAFLATLAK